MDKIHELIIQAEKNLEKEKDRFEHLLTVKSEKTVNEILKKQYTQLSYLSKDQQKLHKLYGLTSMYTYASHFLEQL